MCVWPFLQHINHICLRLFLSSFLKLTSLSLRYKALSSLLTATRQLRLDISIVSSLHISNSSHLTKSATCVSQFFNGLPSLALQALSSVLRSWREAIITMLANSVKVLVKRDMARESLATTRTSKFRQTISLLFSLH